jgi:hypothetical protein
MSDIKFENSNMNCTNTCGYVLIKRMKSKQEISW